MKILKPSINYVNPLAYKSYINGYSFKKRYALQLYKKVFLIKKLEEHDKGKIRKGLDIVAKLQKVQSQDMQSLALKTHIYQRFQQNNTSIVNKLLELIQQHQNENDEYGDNICRARILEEVKGGFNILTSSGVTGFLSEEDFYIIKRNYQERCKTNPDIKTILHTCYKTEINKYIKANFFVNISKIELHLLDPKIIQKHKTNFGLNLAFSTIENTNKTQENKECQEVI